MNTSVHVAQSNYSPVDAVNRHDFGVQKNRKPASTGGGRAWSEDEVCKHIPGPNDGMLTGIAGGLSSSDPPPENAI